MATDLASIRPVQTVQAVRDEQRTFPSFLCGGPNGETGFTAHLKALNSQLLGAPDQISITNGQNCFMSAFNEASISEVAPMNSQKVRRQRRRLKFQQMELLEEEWRLDSNWTPSRITAMHKE